MESSPLSTSNSQEFTALLNEYRNGNQEAGEQLVGIVYQELRRLAQYYLQQERPDHTLQATALVHEAYMQLFGDGVCAWRDRAHFFNVAAQQMRHLLVDHARAAKAEKRYGGKLKLSLEVLTGVAEERDGDLIALDEALDRLEALYPRASRAVELRFFGGLTEKETAEMLEISTATLKRDWDFAKAWLYKEISRGVADQR
jgi:RNA polymerase sigma factor (TIGR02999 family)